MFNKSCDAKCLGRTTDFFRIAGILYDPNKVVETFDSEINEDDLWDIFEELNDKKFNKFLIFFFSQISVLIMQKIKKSSLYFFLKMLE